MNCTNEILNQCFLKRVIWPLKRNLKYIGRKIAGRGIEKSLVQQNWHVLRHHNKIGTSLALEIMTADKSDFD